MSQSRQQAFLQLRPPCVELSSVALKFKTNQASAKTVLLALEEVHRELHSLADANLLDEKLAEYSFFPLTLIFNESQRLSSRGVELAVRCLQILISKGWRARLVPKMAKQLFILLSLMVLMDPKQQTEPATDELKIACFECMAVLIQFVSAASDLLEGLGSQNIVDQLVYQLLEALTLTASEPVQVSAAQALLQLVRVVKSRALLASILPRTVSTLVKVLRPSTQAKRTRKVLVAYLRLLTELLRNALNDTVISEELTDVCTPASSAASNPGGGVVLDKSWLDTTTPQVDLALIQVVKIKNHDSHDVAEALLNLCLMVINDCSQTLARSISLMIDTLTALSTHYSRANVALKRCITSSPVMADILSAKLYDWSQALPRLMQGNNDMPKKQLLQQVATSFIVLAETSNISDQAQSTIASVLIDTVTAAIGPSSNTSKMVSEAIQIPASDLLQQPRRSEALFKPVILTHQSQSSSTTELKRLVIALKEQGFGQKITRNLVDQLHSPGVDRRLSAAWLALRFLQSDDSQSQDMLDIIESDSSPSDLSVSRPFLISDLYSNTLPFLTQYPDGNGEDDRNSRLVALALESLVLQASQLRQAYRPELVDSLFPILTMLSSKTALLQQHAITALDLLAIACEYESAAHMLIENVDYLINAVALRLNAFDVSSTGLQVITMMIRLCGARILPHLDDLIGSIFVALDSFHGYPSLVEQLFEVLKMVVTESSRFPDTLAINAGRESVKRVTNMEHASNLSDVLGDMTTRRIRKNKSDEQHELLTSAPQQPWTTANGDPVDTERDDRADLHGDGDDEQRLEHTPNKVETKLSKSHQLLLNIAQSTVPHLSSPLPQVRHTLLELLEDICPLLAPHEDSFLPMINSIWPAVVSRLLSRDTDGVNDVAYNFKAAAVTIDVICGAAGDFMSSRIEDIFPDLEALFKRTLARVGRPKKDHQRPNLLNGIPASSAVSENKSMVPSLGKTTSQTHTATVLTGETVRTSDAQLLMALIDLMTTILRDVQISQDNADKIFQLLGPLMDSEDVRKTLFEFNEDAVWLIEHLRS